MRNVPRNRTLVLREPELPIVLRVDGKRPDSRVESLEVKGSTRLTLDMVPGPFAEPLDWFLRPARKTLAMGDGQRVIAVDFIHATGIP